MTAGAQGMVASFFAAHRGGALLWPENSLLAFRNAVALGADRFVGKPFEAAALIALVAALLEERDGPSPP